MTHIARRIINSFNFVNKLFSSEECDLTKSLLGCSPFFVKRHKYRTKYRVFRIELFCPPYEFRLVVRFVMLSIKINLINLMHLKPLKNYEH